MTEEKNLDGVSLFERGVAAAAVYLKRKGFEVLEENPEADDGEFTIVALDEAGAIVLVDVFVGGDSGNPFPESEDCESRRASFEAAIVAFFEEAGAGFVDRPARYDRIDIHPIGEDRAIIKHRINGLS